VFEGHLANHGAPSDTGYVLCRECHESVHDETMCSTDADDTKDDSVHT
jgi:hypothetical protein